MPEPNPATAISRRGDEANAAQYKEPPSCGQPEETTPKPEPLYSSATRLQICADYDPLLDVGQYPVKLVERIIGDFQATFARFSMIDADLGSELFCEPRL